MERTEKRQLQTNFHIHSSKGKRERRSPMKRLKDQFQEKDNGSRNRLILLIPEADDGDDDDDD